MTKRQKNIQHNDKKTEEHTTQWQKDRRTDNTMTKRQKNRQHNDKKTEEHTTQWQKEKVQRDKQRSTIHTHKTKDRATWTPLKTGEELMRSGRVSGSCSTSGTRRVNLITHPVISHEWGKDRKVLTNRYKSCYFEQREIWHLWKYLLPTI